MSSNYAPAAAASNGAQVAAEPVAAAEPDAIGQAAAAGGPGSAGQSQTASGPGSAGQSQTASGPGSAGQSQTASGPGSVSQSQAAGAAVPPRKAVVAVIGPLGAGKSTAARLLVELGGWLIDGDALGHEALRQPDIREAVRRRWGPAVLLPDGEVNRRALAQIVFARPEERHYLESLVFPYIVRRMREELARGQGDPQTTFIVIDAAILLEAGWQEPVDRIVYVDAPAELRRARLTARSGWSEQDIAAREAAQWPPERKKAYADAVVLNTGDPQQLRRDLEHLLAAWGIPLRPGGACSP